MAPEVPSAGAPKPKPFEGFNAERETVKNLAEKQEKQDVAADLQKLQGVLGYQQHPLFVLPEGNVSGLIFKQVELQARVTLFTEKSSEFNVATLSPEKTALLHSITRGLLADIAQFETECAQVARAAFEEMMKDPSFAPYRDVLQKELGIGGGAEGFSAVVEGLAAALPVPKKDNKQAVELYEDLQMRQYQLIDSVFNVSLLNIRDAQQSPELQWQKGLTPEERAAALRTLGAFLIKRRVYEGLLRKEPVKKQSKALLYLGIAAEEAAEEGLESLRFGKPVFRAPESLRGIDRALRNRIMSGYEGAKNMVGKKVPSLAVIASMVRDSPVGKEFWGKLFEVESPVTVVMFMMYVHMSDNKLKATMNFASFMATSAASGALLETVSLTLAHGARLASVSNKLKTARALTVLAGLPKHPVVQFTAALGIALGLSPVIDSVTTWVDERIPEGAGKRGVNDFLAVGSGASIIDSAAFGLTEIGAPGMAVKPERDAISYLALELPTIAARRGSWWPTLERDNMNDIRSWNEKVDIAIAQEKNPILRDRYKLEKADVAAWADREAFHFFGQAKYGRDLESQLGEELVVRKVLSIAGALDFVELATADVAGEERPDYTIKQLEDNTDTPQGRAKAYIDGLSASKKPEDVELCRQWKEYRRVTDDLARHTVVFRHLGLYNREEWLGTNAREPAFTGKVQRGIAAEIAKLSERQQAVQSSNYPGLSAGKYATELVDTVPYVDAETTLQWLNLVDESGLDTQRAEIQTFKTFLRLNVIYIHGRDLDEVLKPVAQASLSGRKATFEDLKKVYESVSDFLFERSLKDTDVQLMPSEDIQTLQINPRVYVEQRGVFGREKQEMLKLLQKDREFIHSLNGDCVIMRSADYSSFLRVECVVVSGKSADRSDWTVAEHTTLIPRNLQDSRDPSTRIYEKPQTTLGKAVPYSEWIKTHPDDVARFSFPFTRLESANAALEQESVDAGSSIAKAEWLAERRDDLFIQIPGVNEYRRAAKNGQVTLRALPASGIPGREMYKFTYAEGDKKFTYRVRSQEFTSDETLSADDRALIRDVITTPIEGADRQSVEGVMHLWDYEDTDGHGVERYNQLLSSIQPLYQASLNQKKFLEVFFSQMKGEGGMMSSHEQIARVVNEMRSFNEFLKTAPAPDIAAFTKGVEILEAPIEKGVYTKNFSKEPNTTPLYFQYIRGQGWQWHPGVVETNPYPKQWYPVSTTRIPWKGPEPMVSPAKENVAILKRLQALKP